MRHFITFAYNGTAYCGWQRQPEQMTVQQKLEASMSLILGEDIRVVGCGRTDTGVHATHYVAHFDFAGAFPKAFAHRLNKVLPNDIAVGHIRTVADRAHARFDAYQRSYEYHLDLRKNPFERNTVYFYPYTRHPDFDLAQQAARLLLNYTEFAPFCKTHHDAKTLFCDLSRAEWVNVSDRRWVFHITSNRFLRGMVRLIVGMCLNVGRGQLTLDDVNGAMEAQKPLPKNWSVPAEGLFLTKILYPYETAPDEPTAHYS